MLYLLIILKDQYLGLVPHEFFSSILETNKRCNVRIKCGDLRVFIFILQLNVKHHHYLYSLLKHLSFMLSKQLGVNLSHVGMYHQVNVREDIFLEICPLHAGLYARVKTKFISLLIILCLLFDFRESFLVRIKVKKLIKYTLMPFLIKEEAS